MNGERRIRLRRALRTTAFGVGVALTLIAGSVPAVQATSGPTGPVRPTPVTTVYDYYTCDGQHQQRSNTVVRYPNGTQRAGEIMSSTWSDYTFVGLLTEEQGAAAQCEDSIASVEVADTAELDDVPVEELPSYPSYSQTQEGAQQVAASKPASVTKCKAISSTVNGYNFAGMKLLSFKQSTDWCWKDGKITYKNSTVEAHTHFIGWSYEGLVTGGDTSSTGSTTMWTRYRQGKFKHCVLGPWGAGCTERTPWIKHTVAVGGSYTPTYGS